MSESTRHMVGKSALPDRRALPTKRGRLSLGLRAAAHLVTRAVAGMMAGSQDLEGVTMSAELLPSVCPHDCPSVCALEVERLDGGRLGKVKGSQRNPYTAGVICAKVARYAERFHHPERLSRLLRRVGSRRGKAAPNLQWGKAHRRNLEVR